MALFVFFLCHFSSEPPSCSVPSIFRGRIWIGVIRWEPLDVHLGSTRAEVMACAFGSGGYEGNSSTYPYGKSLYKPYIVGIYG